jgi:hypothetical protein
MPPEKSRQLPPEIRKACMILGLPPERLTIESVNQAWQNQVAAFGVSTDLEAVSFLNTAKKSLLKWLGSDSGFSFGGGAGPGRELVFNANHFF